MKLVQNRALAILCLVYLGSFRLTSALKILNLVPHYCDKSLESKHELKSVQLKPSGNDSFINIGASVLQGIKIVPNYKCLLVVESPPNTGLILTVRKAALNDNDTITFRSGSNPDRVWQRQFTNDDDDVDNFEFDEVVSVVNRDYPSSMTVKFEPTPGVSQLNAGFDLAVTLYKEKQESCGSDFDCQNNRCITSSLRCDGYNNCGNNQDEVNCSGISWWIVTILVALAIVVVALAIFVWIRMSKA